MRGRRALQALLRRRAGATTENFMWTPEAERMRAALDMHEFGVKLYRQRMRREHPAATEAEIDDLVRAWLAAPPVPGRLRLPSRTPGHGHAG